MTTQHTPAAYAIDDPEDGRSFGTWRDLETYHSPNFEDSIICTTTEREAFEAANPGTVLLSDHIATPVLWDRFARFLDLNP